MRSGRNPLTLISPNYWNANLQGVTYRTHSLRRTKASIIYKATDNLRAVQILLDHTKIENTVGYTIGRFGLQGRARYYGAWTDVSGNATGEVFQRFGSMVMFDLSASLQLNDDLSIRAGAENIFDTYPDEATNQAVRGLIYSRNAPYDTDGRQYSVRVGINF